MSTTIDQYLSVSISWNELPAYGARLIRSGADSVDCEVEIVATRPTIPIVGMEEIANRKIHWVERAGVHSWSDLNLPIPDIFFQAGWYIDSFICLGDEVRKNGGKVVLLSDNCWRNTPRQWLGAIKYRLVYRRLFSRVWGPGSSGQRLMRFLGVPANRVHPGLYGTDPTLFELGPPLPLRAKQFMFAGRLTRKKGIPWLADAFGKFHKSFPDWQLAIYGSGECRSCLEGLPGVVLNDFAQPAQVAQGMQASRFLVLPTLVDHWPLVVSEAALAGCGMILSREVGNLGEFLGDSNGFQFKARSSGDLCRAMQRAASLSEEELSLIADESRRRGLQYTPSTWAVRFKEILAAEAPPH